MIRSQRSVITVLIVLFLFSLPLIFSCTGPESEKPAERPPFSGTWDIRETRTGCNEEIIASYVVEITLNNNVFSLRETTNKFQDACRLNAENILLCDGNFSYSDGSYSYPNESYTLWFNDENNDNMLIGDGNWTWHPQDSDDKSCDGDSGITAERISN